MIVLLGGIAALPPVSIDLYLPAFPALARDLGASAAAVQLTLTAYLIGQVLGLLLGGPVSDTFGRRRPALVGLAVFSALSLLCAVAPSVEVLTVLRLGQGLSGGVALVIGPALVRDIAVGRAGAQLMSWILAIGMIAPVVAPLIGSQLLLVGSWRSVFVVIAAYGAVWTLLCWRRLPETLAPAARSSGALRASAVVVRRLLADRRFVGITLAGGLSGAAFFAYLAASSLVFQSIHGLSAQLYGAVFALNGVGFLLATQVNHALLRRRSSEAVLLLGLLLGAAAGVALLALNLVGVTGVLADAVPLFFLVASTGFVFPNATALALIDYGDAAGTATAVIRFVQMGLGAAAAPLVGLAGFATTLPLAIASASLTVAGLLVALVTPMARPRDVPVTR